MAEPTEVSSILAIDIGSVNTQAVLIALVEGSYRFVARAQSPTTQEEPWADVAIGVRHAIEQLQRMSARPLLSDDGNVISPEHDDGSGADLCVITSSAAQPLRLVLAGLVGELSLDSVRRASAGTYSSVEDVISLLGTGRKSDEMRAKSILAVQPDAVCIAGGTDGGSTTPVLNLVESVALGASLIEPLARPAIVYAGNSALRARVKEIVGNDISLVAVEGNVRPGLGAEDLGPLQAELDALHASTKLSKVNGLNACAAWSSIPIMSTARSFGNMVRYLSMIGDPRAGVLGVDVGASSTMVGAAFNGKLRLTVRSDIGSAYGGSRLLSEAKIANIARWLPFQIHPTDLEAFVIDKELRPLTIPADGRELLIEQALAREAIRSIAKLAQPSWRRLAPHGRGSARPLFERIVGAGAVIAKATRPGQAALVLLDALEPIGVFELSDRCVWFNARVGCRGNRASVERGADDRKQRLDVTGNGGGADRHRAPRRSNLEPEDELRGWRRSGSGSCGGHAGSVAAATGAKGHAAVAPAPGHRHWPRAQIDSGGRRRVGLDRRCARAAVDAASARR